MGVWSCNFNIKKRKKRRKKDMFWIRCEWCLFVSSSLLGTPKSRYTKLLGRDLSSTVGILVVLSFPLWCSFVFWCPDLRVPKKGAKYLISTSGRKVQKKTANWTSWWLNHPSEKYAHHIGSSQPSSGWKSRINLVKPASSELLVGHFGHPCL